MMADLKLEPPDDVEIAKSALREIAARADHIPSRIEAAKVLLRINGLQVEGPVNPINVENPAWTKS